MAEARDIEASETRGEDLVYEEVSFGTAFLIVTLYFLDNTTAVLQRTAEILEDKGKLVLGLIVEESLWARFYEKKRGRETPFEVSLASTTIARFWSYCAGPDSNTKEPSPPSFRRPARWNAWSFPGRVSPQMPVSR
ncbi:MAG: hypothetical protein SWK76_00440 [Actinomycetota bacterium]|nr:hypothetical protein [Actinomycetota bacterium]